MKKVVSLALLATTLAFSQAGIMGGSEGFHQINAKTLGQWKFNIGTGGNIAFGSWALSRGGIFEVKTGKNTYKRYSFNDVDYSQAGNFFVSVGLLDFLDIGLSLPVYYEHANSKGPTGAMGPSGYANMWTTSRGDLDIFTKIGLPFASAGVFSSAIMLDLYAPTGEKSAGVRPRHVWYLNSRGYTHPFTANDWVMGAGLALTFDFTKIGAPITWNLAASYVYPLDHSEVNTLVYSSGVNWNALSWLTPFVEFSAEMRLQSKGQYKFDPMVDPMLLTPGLRFHLPYNVEFAIGLEVAIRAFVEGFDHFADIYAGDDHMIYYLGEHNVKARYAYASTPFISGAALLSIAIDAKGSPKDSDGDGVSDDNDKCARTPAGTKVDAEGCPVEDLEKLAARERAIADSLARVDSDNDGIPDVVDKCPNTVAGISVDSIGCMLDFDKDGVADNYDKCPNTPAGVPVNLNGCPMDFDNDGVPDYLDKCPNTAANMEVDSTGCVFDTDRDGIPDYKDKCPGTPSGHAVDSLGCLPDFDKDGVADFFDKCPNTLPGVRVDEKGCPLNKKEDLDQLKKGIQFKTGSKKLTKSSYSTLNDIVALMNRIPEANLEVQGHTDNRGSNAKNLKLSQTRAKVVVDYLVKKGIDRDRLRAVGYGSEKPIADNDDADGRAQNRRVELLPFAK
ncbi:OmpA family protein [Fibrobacter sp. UWB11]|uniref:OmpA family protein n=1 Tax=Fibrobacter sp. UWB11 TaxID=1896202 RepID=UPI0009266305|nr:OmpA family protein [Fibrobacter sp. UWB11]SIO04189.1 Outer membrane protein OmpA [Fibrobacter sp. UWB11]